MKTIVKKGSKQYREEHLAADQILFELANDETRELSYEEREFLMQVGRLDPNRNKSVKFQLEREVGRASRILKERARAGLNGEYEKAKQHCEEVQKSHPALIQAKKDEILELQKQLRSLESELQQAPHTVEKMENARSNLQKPELCPPYAYDEASQNMQKVREGETAKELRKLKAEKLRWEQIVELNKGPRGLRESYMKNSPEFHKTVRTTNQSGEKVVEVVFERDAWQRAVNRATTELAKASEQIVEVQRKYDEEVRKAQEPKNFWLNDTLPI